MRATLTPEQLECLASPACSGVFFAVRSLGKATAKEVGAKTNRSPATVLYHLGRLTQTGLVHVVEKRAAVRKPEAVFEATSQRFELPRDAETKRLRVKTVQAGLRQAIRGWERAAEEDAGPAHVITTQCRLSAEDAREFERLIEKAASFVRERESSEGILIHWSSVVYPDV